MSTIRLTYLDTPPLPPSVVESRLRALRGLWVVAYWSEYNDTDPLVRDARATYQGDVRIHRLHFGSPMDIVLGWPSTGAACLASARGILYLWNKWQDARVKHARADYEVEAWKLMKESLATPQLGELSKQQNHRHFLPTKEEILLAAEAIRSLEEVSEIDAGSGSTDRQ